MRCAIIKTHFLIEFFVVSVKISIVENSIIISGLTILNATLALDPCII